MTNMDHSLKASFAAVCFLLNLFGNGSAQATENMTSFDGWCRAQFGNEWSGQRSIKTGGPLCARRTFGGLGLEYRKISEATICPGSSVKLNRSGSMYACRDPKPFSDGPQNLTSYCIEKHGDGWEGTTNRITGKPMCTQRKGLSLLHRAVDESDLCPSGKASVQELDNSYQCSNDGRSAANGEPNGFDDSSGGRAPDPDSAQNGKGQSEHQQNKSQQNPDCGDHWPGAKLAKETTKAWESHQNMAVSLGYSNHEYWQHWRAIYRANIAAFSKKDCVDIEKVKAYQLEIAEQSWLGMVNFAQLQNLISQGEGIDLKTSPITGSVSSAGLPAAPRYLSGWGEVRQALEEATRYRAYPIQLEDESRTITMTVSW